MRQIHHVARSVPQEIVESFDLEYVTFYQGKIVIMTLSTGVTKPRLLREAGFPRRLADGGPPTRDDRKCEGMAAAAELSFGCSSHT